MKKFLSLALVTVFALTGFVGCGLVPTDDLSYVTVDINPSFELVVEDDVVLSVTPLNEDADVVIEAIGEIKADTTVDEALSAIVDAAAEEGFLTEDNSDVTLTVVEENQSERKTEKLYKKLEEVIAKEAEKAGREFIKARREANGVALELKELQADPAYAENEDVQELKPGEYRMICEVMENCDLTLEEALELDMAELLAKLKEARIEQKGKTSQEWKEANKARRESAKQAAKDAMDAFLESFGAQLGTTIPEIGSYATLEDILKAIEERTDDLGDTELTEAEVAQLAEIFSVTEAQLLQMVRDAEVELSDVFELANKAIPRDADKQTRDAILNELKTFMDTVKTRALTELAQNEDVAALLAAIKALNLDVTGLEAAIEAGDLQTIEKLLGQTLDAIEHAMDQFRPQNGPKPEKK